MSHQAPQKNPLPLVAITMGDPAGIGPEVLLKYAVSYSRSSPRAHRILAVADGGILQETAEALGTLLPLHRMTEFHEEDFRPNALNVLDLKNVEAGSVVVGRAGAASGKAAVECVRKATELAMKGEVDAIVTAPISKEAIHLAGYPYPGHTELLAELTKTKDFAMMMVGGKIQVVLATTHIPLNKVARAITRKRVARTIRLAHRSLSFYQGFAPSIAVAALNPHAGDGGVIGREEVEKIIPAIEECAGEGIQVSGPYPADSLFAKAKDGRFDAIIVMYHDQGLIPVKMEGFGKGINVTLGLPIVRVSVDHGTALDIAGKGIADPSSMEAAVEYAVEMAKRKAGGTEGG